VSRFRRWFGGSRRRRLLHWQTMPEQAAPETAWWAGERQWFPLGTPPRREGTLDLLIDGEDVFRAMWTAIRQAKHAVWVVDWAMTGSFSLIRGVDRRDIPAALGANGPGYTVFDLLTETASRVDVRLLLWNGSLLFRPRALATRWLLHRLRRACPTLRGLPDRHIGLTHCHHQKAVVVDGQIAFVGGLDMTDFDTDRWDTADHPVRDGLNWHDLCFRLYGPPAADVARNFIQRWQAVTGETLTLPPTAQAATNEIPPPVRDPQDQFTACPLQVVRTIPPKVYDWAPDGEYGNAWAYRRAFESAQTFIYLENQYLWSQAVSDELIAALRRVSNPDFRIVLVLPARPNIGKDDTDRQVRRLLEADGGQGRVLVFTLYTSGPHQKEQWVYKPIYVHAKVGIVDDRWATVGSANLNGRGMQSDSEINVQVLEPQVARRLRLRLWSEHLALPIPTLETLSPAQAIDRLWKPIAGNGRTVIDRRSGRLPAMAVPYDFGDMPADLALGELEAHVLDV
jgi:phosphatidylserine/phosphatidylglycerophosphate/cardiolipin synthase-like enzyme